MKRRSAQSPQTFLSLHIPSRSFAFFYFPTRPFTSRPLTSLRLSSLRLTSPHFLSSHFPHTVPSVSAHKKGKFVRGGQENGPLEHKNDRFVRGRQESGPFAHKNGKSVREGQKKDPFAHKNGIFVREGQPSREESQSEGQPTREGSQNEGQTKRVAKDMHNEKPRDSGETRGLLISDVEGRPEGAERVGSGPEQARGQGHFKTLSSSRRRAFSPSTLRSTILPSRMR